MYNLIEYSDNYSKISWRLSKYHREEQTLADAATIANFHAANNRSLFKFKQKITGETGNSGTTNIEITLPSKYLSNFGRTLELWNQFHFNFVWKMYII